MSYLSNSIPDSDNMTLAGYAQESNQNCVLNELLSDTKRVEYMAGYLDSLLRAIK